VIVETLLLLHDLVTNSPLLNHIWGIWFEEWGNSSSSHSLHFCLVWGMEWLSMTISSLTITWASTKIHVILWWTPHSNLDEVVSQTKHLGRFMISYIKIQIEFIVTIYLVYLYNWPVWVEGSFGIKTPTLYRWEWLADRETWLPWTNR